MGKTQSKRSVDITTEGGKAKGADDEVAVTGKLEKIEDVDQQQKQLNGDAANQSESNDAEKKDVDESENDKDLTTEKSASGDAGSVQNGADVNENGDQSKTFTATASTEASSDEMKPKETEAAAAAEDISPLADESMKKSKKEKVKKKWSFRSISFGKKDKQKPTKTEETNGESVQEKPAVDTAETATVDIPKVTEESVPSNPVEHQNGDASENVEEKNLNSEDIPSSTDQKSTEAVADVTTPATVVVASEENVATVSSNNESISTAIDNQTITGTKTSTAEVIIETTNAIATEKTNGVTTEEKNGLDAHSISDTAAVDTDKAVADVIVDSKIDSIEGIASTNGHQNGANADGESEANANAKPEVEADDTEPKTATEQSKSQIEVNIKFDNTPDTTQLASSHTITTITTTTTNSITPLTATDIACVATPHEPNAQSEFSNDLKTTTTATENYKENKPDQQYEKNSVEKEISACETTIPVANIVEPLIQLTYDTKLDDDNHDINNDNDDNQPSVTNSDTVTSTAISKNLQPLEEIVNVDPNQIDENKPESTSNNNEDNTDQQQLLLQKEETIQSSEIEMEQIQQREQDAAMVPPPLPASPPPSQMFAFAFNSEDDNGTLQSAANVVVENIGEKIIDDHNDNDDNKGNSFNNADGNDDMIAKEMLLAATALVDNIAEKAIEMIEQKQKENDLSSLDKEHVTLITDEALNTKPITIQDNQIVEHVTEIVTTEEDTPISSNNDDTGNANTNDDDDDINTNNDNNTRTTGADENTTIFVIPEEERCDDFLYNGDLSMEKEEKEMVMQLPLQPLAAATDATTTTAAVEDINVNDVPFDSLNSNGDEPSLDLDRNTNQQEQQQLQHQQEISLSPSPTKDIASAKDLKENAIAADQKQTTTQQDLSVTCE